MRTTLALDNSLVAEAQRLTGMSQKSPLVREALTALIGARARAGLHDSAEASQIWRRPRGGAPPSDGPSRHLGVGRPPPPSRPRWAARGAPRARRCAWSSISYRRAGPRAPAGSGGDPRTARPGDRRDAGGVVGVYRASRALWSWDRLRRRAASRRDEANRRHPTLESRPALDRCGRAIELGVHRLRQRAVASPVYAVVPDRTVRRPRCARRRQTPRCAVRHRGLSSPGRTARCCETA